MTRLRVTLIVAVVCLQTWQSFAQDRRESPGARVIDLNITLNLPVGSCTAPQLTLALTAHLGVPAGVEMLPGPCDSVSPSAFTEQIPLIGLRLESALALIEKADGRYHWVDADGVIVMRPHKAWSDDKHFLNVALEHFELRDANIGGALDALLAPLKGEGNTGALIMAADENRITVSLGPASLGEALDAVVRSHGNLRWEIQYCLPEVAADIALVRVSAPGGRGLGTYAGKPPRDADGKPFNRCLQQ
jgi:hypothetical protein